jgi:hypothetical protein
MFVQKTIPLLLMVVILFFAACRTEEIERLRTENDSLRRELETRHSMVDVMKDVKGLLDSIDISRKHLQLELHEGTSYSDFIRL